jgi:hypothetical protein
MKPMKKKFKESEIVVAFTQYQVARSLQILVKMLFDWSGDELFYKAPDNIIHYLEEVRLHGVRAKALLERAGFTFKKGTMEAI